MSAWKDNLRLLMILVACGAAGSLDYQDAVMMEEALRADKEPVLPDCGCCLYCPSRQGRIAYHGKRDRKAACPDPLPGTPHGAD